MALKEKADSMQDHTDNFTRVMETVRDDHMKKIDEWKRDEECL